MAQLEVAFTGTDKPTATERAHPAGQMSTKSGLKATCAPPPTKPDATGQPPAQSP
jgi:hypothetical protein